MTHRGELIEQENKAIKLWASLIHWTFQEGS